MKLKGLALFLLVVGGAHAACTITTGSPLSPGTITFRPNTTYTNKIATSGCAAPVFTITAGTIPYGLALNASTGVLSGSLGWCPSCGPTQLSSQVFSATDLVASGANTVNSATHNFVTADVGAYLQVTAGTGWKVGYYVIQSVSANTAFLDRSPATAGTHGGTYTLLSGPASTNKGTYNFTISVKDVNGSPSQAYALPVTLALPQFTLSADHKTVTANYQNGTVRTFHRQYFPAESLAITGTTYYANASTGNDTNPCSLAQPCATINEAYSKVAKAGDGVQVAPGNYVENSDVVMTKTGTAANPIIVTCVPAYQCTVTVSDAFIQAKPFTPVFKFDGASAQYGIVNGFIVQGTLARGESKGAGPEHTVANFRNSAHYNTYQNNIMFYGAHGCFKVVDFNATFNTMDGNMCFVGGNSGLDHGVYITASNITITRNIFTDYIGYGLQFYTFPANPVVTQNTIAYNGAYTYGVGILVGGADGLFQYNIVAETGDSPGTIPGGGYVGFVYYRSGCFGNTVIDNIMAFNVTQSMVVDALNGASSPGMNTDDYNVDWPIAPLAGLFLPGPHNQNVDPKLVNPAGGDFRLTSSTPVRCPTCYLEPVTNPCDVNSDGAINIVDVQLTINQALGMAPCTVNLGGAGACNIVDVQRVIVAAQGGSCNTGP